MMTVPHLDSFASEEREFVCEGGGGRDREREAAKYTDEGHLRVMMFAVDVSSGVEEPLPRLPPPRPHLEVCQCAGLLLGSNSFVPFHELSRPWKTSMSLKCLSIFYVGSLVRFGFPLLRFFFFFPFSSFQCCAEV
jgi:hypothetical protein